MRLAFFLCVMLSLLSSANAQDTAVAKRSLGENDPSVKHPLGKKHPQSSPSIAELDFLLGSFEGVGETVVGDETRESSEILGGTYCLNGYAIRTWSHSLESGDEAGALIAVPSQGKPWKVLGFGLPRYERSVWSGQDHGNTFELIELDDQSRPVRRMTFSSIKDHGFNRTLEVSLDHGETWDVRSDIEFLRTETLLVEHGSAESHGQAHQEASDALSDFEFMVGEFDTEEEIRNPDGSWRHSVATWNGFYFLQGRAIRDEYWNAQEKFATMNLRVYDASEGIWVVTFVSMPGLSTSVWKGGREGSNMVMRQGNDQNGARLTFSRIRPDGYDWKSQSLLNGQATDNWREYATRAKPR